MTLEDIKNATSSFEGFDEFIILMDFQDWLSVKNWITDNLGNGEVKYKQLTMEYCIENKFVSFDIDGITIHAKFNESGYTASKMQKSFICPVKVIKP